MIECTKTFYILKYLVNAVNSYEINSLCGSLVSTEEIL